LRPPATLGRQPTIGPRFVASRNWTLARNFCKRELTTRYIRIFDQLERPLTVRGATREVGFVHLPHRWHDGVAR